MLYFNIQIGNPTEKGKLRVIGGRKATDPQNMGMAALPKGKTDKNPKV